MRHTTIRNGKLHVWQTERLWELAKGLEEFELDLETIVELDEDCWFGSDRKPTLRAIAAHCKKINEASNHPIILNDDGSLMDGGHRVCNALLRGKKTIMAVRFKEMPPPDSIQEI